MLFSAPMVRAILAGSKTQTRRVMKHLPTAPPDGEIGVGQFEGRGSRQLRHVALVVVRDAANCIRPSTVLHCPYGQPGDRLWVRETFYAWGRWETRFSAKKGRDEWHFIDMTIECGKAYRYAADGRQPQPMGGKRHKNGITPTWWKRPAIHMPRAASRTTLELTGVRVERLQDISETDARAEGTAAHNSPAAILTGYRQGYRLLWESINGAGSWAENPFVWVISFRRLDAS